VISFMDKVMQAFYNFTPHRIHIEQSKISDRECDQNTVPGMIRDKTDWSENGECKVKNQIQSEYWSIVYYSLLITISSFLITSIWKDRTSAPKRGDEVTVEPHYKSFNYNVDRRDNLRHRKWYRLAFLQVTNDKKHDCWSSQTFVCRRLAFYDIFHTQGLEEALKFALYDEAEVAREKAAELAQNAQSTSS
jgi:hypothetical protein